MPNPNFSSALSLLAGTRPAPRPATAMTSLLDLFARQTPKPPKPRVFVSYHHAYDEPFAERFRRLFDDTHDIVTDRSLEERIDSDDSDYVYQRIREDFITGTSCTIVLCGRETMNRKHVDWEIKATLDKGHSLLGVRLPTLPCRFDGKYVVPDRLHENLMSGYAHWTAWTGNALEMRIAILEARVKALDSHPQRFAHAFAEPLRDR